jgi:hypothetical protein
VNWRRDRVDDRGVGFSSLRCWVTQTPSQRLIHAVEKEGLSFEPPVCNLRPRNHPAASGSWASRSETGAAMAHICLGCSIKLLL